MGYYINPPNETKEAWLAKHGVEVPKLFPWAQTPSHETLPVILVDNGHFTAAGVAFDEREQRMMTENPNDKRPMRFYYVHIDDLKAVGAIPLSYRRP